MDGLAKAGFKTNLGLNGTGFVQLSLTRGGGYYFGKFLLMTHLRPMLRAAREPDTFRTDVGASKHIINGDIKVKNGSAIVRFTDNGLQFEDGTALVADVVVYATG